MAKKNSRVLIEILKSIFGTNAISVSSQKKNALTLIAIIVKFVKKERKNGMTVNIERSKKGPYYELTIDGEFAGNFDTVKEAADEVEETRKEKEGAA